MHHMASTHTHAHVQPDDTCACSSRGKSCRTVLLHRHCFSCSAHANTFVFTSCHCAVKCNPDALVSVLTLLVLLSSCRCAVKCNPEPLTLLF
jgi:hypothetical protein